jgi:signal transduction histidine kinase
VRAVPVAELDADLVPDPVIRLDGGWVVVAANAAAVALAGRPIVGQALADTLAPSDSGGRGLFGTCWPSSAALPSVTLMPEQALTVRVGDGSRIPVRVTARYERDDAGQLAGAVLVLRPAHRRGDGEPTGAEVVATVSHELRSPLTSVKGYTSLLLNRWDRIADDQKKLMLEQVQHDADRVTRLITELLDISRLETGRLVLRRQLVDLPVMAAEVVARLALVHDGLDCTIAFPDDVPRVYADPDKLEQVLTNLVENAAKYGSLEGIRIDGEMQAEAVSVAVTDRGEGILEEDLGRVFEKFFRRDHGRPTGTGLGLWISRGLVEAHGGRLTAEVAPGGGTSFRFTVPIVDVDAALSGDAGSDS